MRRLLFALLLGCSSTPAAKTEPPRPAGVQAAIAAPDRDPEDKKLDAGRRPAEVLTFFGIAPGQHVAELASGGGYTTEILARTVGEGGIVYGQNPKLILEKFAEKPWSSRLAKPVMKNVVRVDRELGDPLPEEAHNLDAVVMILFYHDSVWLETDRAKMNSAVFKALKKGGVYGIVDHSAKEAAGTTEVKTFHRIEEKVVREEVEAAGFKLTASGDFLRNANDTRDWNASPMSAGDKRGTSDRFVLKFVKP